MNENNFDKYFPLRGYYRKNSMFRTILAIFFAFIETVTSGNLARLQDWLHALADVLPVMRDAYLRRYDDWTPTESQQVYIDSWTRANERITIRTLGGIEGYFKTDFRLGVEYPLQSSSTYVYLDTESPNSEIRRMYGHENH